MQLFFKYSITIVFLCFGMICDAQDSLQNKTTKLSDSELVAGESYVIDTIIDGKALFKKVIKPIIEVDLSKELQDHEFASEVDKKWIEELYSTSLFDTIYREVTDLKYEAVYYPELSTDTLKARLERLNARTPFNVEYNPQLENIITTIL